MSNAELDVVKTRTKEPALFSRNYNNNVPPHLSKEVFLSLQNLHKNRNFVIQTSYKGHSVVDKTDYLDKMENLVNDARIFEKINPKNDGIFSFAANQEKPVDYI